MSLSSFPSVIGRFAPSPSGRMHLGNALAALLAWLSVRSQGGEMLLRMEDLDTLRCSEEKAALIREDLAWLGLDWDRETAPQRQRAMAYEQALAQLEARGLVYPCWCTRGLLAAVDAPHAADGHPIYAGTCRGLSPEQREARSAETASRRLLVPDRMLGFIDGLQGWYGEVLSRDCGDFVLRRADGVFVYQLAVVVDDMAAGVTEVVRGRDLLTSTPRQLYLYQMLGGQAPAYWHTPLLLAPDGRRLSKREADLDFGRLREKYTAPVIIGRLAHWAGLIDRPEPATPAELAPGFTWSRVSKEDIVLPQRWPL